MGHTGENEQALRKIMDFTRMGSIIILAFHFYYSCHAILNAWKLTIDFVDTVFTYLVRTGLFDSIYISKGISLCLLLVSLIGVKGKKSDNARISWSTTLAVAGLIMFLFGHQIFTIRLSAEEAVIAYFVVTVIGYILILTGGTRLSRYLKIGLIRDVSTRKMRPSPRRNAT